MAFTIEIPVRFRDIDGMRHVNNAVYFTYMETARTEYYRKLTDIKTLEEFDFILARAECDFKAPIALGDVVALTVWLTKIGDTSFSFEYEFRNKETDALYATAKSVQVTYDYAKGRPIAIPPRLRMRLEKELANLFKTPNSRNR